MACSGVLTISPVSSQSIHALVPLLPEQIATEIREPLSQIQLMYASKAGEGESPSESGTEDADEGGPAAERSRGDDGAGGSGLWTPPGT